MTGNIGVSVSTLHGTTRLEVVAAEVMSYATIHPAGYILEVSNPALANIIGTRPLMVVIDQRVNEIYGDALREYLRAHVNCLGYVLLNGSENEKSWPQLQRICDEAIDIHFPRNGIIMAVGGGVTLDIAGFAASIFRRGVDYIRVPTSLIGLVDVAVGIKHGINARHCKSIVGSYYPALANVNDTHFLATLPRRHVACGVAEIIKMALIRDAQLFSLLETRIDEFLPDRVHKSAVVRSILIRAERLMMEELQPNLREACLRRLPDFGHTFSPGIELASDYSINHGEAVGMDMLISTGIAVLKGLCSSHVWERLRSLLVAAELPLTHEVCTPGVLLESVSNLRAHRAGNLNLVVPTHVGRADFVQHVSREELEQSLAFIAAGSSSHVSAAHRPGRDVS